MMKITKGDIQRDMQEKKNSSDAQYVHEMSDEDTKIQALIREKYSLSMEVALHRKKIMRTVEAAEWTEYTHYVEECIAKVREGSEADAE